ncbi:unnamed protein product [Calypogeia fissa]
MLCTRLSSCWLAGWGFVFNLVWDFGFRLSTYHSPTREAPSVQGFCRLADLIHATCRHNKASSSSDFLQIGRPDTT